MCILWGSETQRLCTRRESCADEPTSGLDSTTAMHLLTTLRKLAEGGRSIITTIHQPASRWAHVAHNLLIMSSKDCLQLSHYVAKFRPNRWMCQNLLSWLLEACDITDTGMEWWY